MFRKLMTLLVLFFPIAALAAAPGDATTQPAKKKLLVVSVTSSFRHATISDIEKTLAELADSTGAFTLDFIRQPAGVPGGPTKPPMMRPGAPAPKTPEEQVAYDKAEAKYKADRAAYEAKWNAPLTDSLKTLTASTLAQYDGVVFASTCGEIPLPDKQALLDYVRAGHAFIGIHAASDTLHEFPGFGEMIGAEFATHGAQASADLINRDPAHPATKHLPPIWHIEQEELYTFVRIAPDIHELLSLPNHPNSHAPGHYPIAWTHTYGTGKVFYTALGHRDDFYNPDPALKGRKNPPELVPAYRAHLQGGILWSLGLAEASPVPAK